MMHVTAMDVYFCIGGGFLVLYGILRVLNFRKLMNLALVVALAWFAAAGFEVLWPDIVARTASLVLASIR